MSPQIDAIVLAAGLSTRAGERNKLLLPLAGKPLIAHAVEAALGSRACKVHVVTGYQSDELAAALNDYTVNFVHNPNYAEGMSSSIKSGIRALPTDLDGVVLCLGDMPLVVSAHLDLLIKNYATDVACAPYYRERRGHQYYSQGRCFLNYCSSVVTLAHVDCWNNLNRLSCKSM